MSPEVRAMIDAYFVCRHDHPRMADTWKATALAASSQG